MDDASTVSRPRMGAAVAVGPLAAGLLFLALLLREPTPHVHFSGDSALKEYLVRQWTERGTLTNAIDWSGAEPWLADFWARHRYPLGESFLHEGKVVFSPWFGVLAFPFYVVGGYYGLHAMAAISMLGVWLALWSLLRDRGLEGFPLFVALTLAVFSPLTFYGAIFWEHAPALALLFWAWWLLGRRSLPRAGPVIGGALLVWAVDLRPELAVGAAALALYAAVSIRPIRWFVVGVAAGLLPWAAVNWIATGSPIGIHHNQPLLMSGGAVGTKLAGYYSIMALKFALGAPEVPLTVAIALVALWFDPLERRRRGAIVAVLLVTAAALPFMTPNAGGHQIFLRYMLGFIPAGALLAAYLTRYKPWLGWLLLAVALVKLPEMGEEMALYRDSYGDKIKPIEQLITVRRPEAIFVINHFIVAELASFLPEAPFLRSEPDEELADLIAEAAAHVDLNRTVVLLNRYQAAEIFPLELEDGTLVQAFVRPPFDGVYIALELRTDWAPPPEPRGGLEQR